MAEIKLLWLVRHYKLQYKRIQIYDVKVKLKLKTVQRRIPCRSRKSKAINCSMDKAVGRDGRKDNCMFCHRKATLGEVLWLICHISKTRLLRVYIFSGFSNFLDFLKWEFHVKFANHLRSNLFDWIFYVLLWDIQKMISKFIIQIIKSWYLD